MNAFWVLTRKELSAALLSPIAYTVAAVFLLVCPEWAEWASSRL